MPILDLSFNNPTVKTYFEYPRGKVPDAPAPVSELMYLHTHPLIKPNFLLELEVLFNKVDPKKIPQSLGDRIHDHTVEVAKLSTTLSDETAPSALFHLREVYRLLKSYAG